MMSVGSTLAIMRDTADPRKSELTRTVGAALAAGADFHGERPLSDSIDEAGDRLVSWTFDGNKGLKFTPDFDEETITVSEFRKRFESLEWCEANPTHPITYLRAYRDKMGGLQDFLRGTAPAARIRKGRRIGIIPHDATPEERGRILDALK